MLYLAEVSDSICFLESRLKVIAEKTDTIDTVAGRVEGLPIQELLARVDTLEANVGKSVNYEYGDSSSGIVAHMEERVNELDSSQKMLLEMINDMSEDFRATLDVVRNKIADVNTRLNLTMQAMANQEEKGCTIDTWDVLKKELCSQFFPENVEILARRKLRDLKHTGNIQEYVKQFAGLMLDIRDMSKKDKVFYFVEGLKPWAKTKLYEQRVQDLTSVYAAVERLFDLTSDSQDVRRHQSSSLGRNRNSQSSSLRGGKDSSRDRKAYQSNTVNTCRRLNNRSPPKCPLSCFICEGPHLARECPNKVDFHVFQATLILDSDDKSNQAEDEVGQIEGGRKTRIRAIKYLSSLQKKSGERNVPTKMGLLYVDTWINQKQTKSTMVDLGATHNFITEAEVRRLRLRWEKDSGRMKVVNSVVLPVVGLMKQMMIKLEGWKGPVNFVVVKMDDFDVVLGMGFLLEHQVIPMPSAKCLVITESFPTIVQTDIRQPNRFKMISIMQLNKGPVQEEPPFAAILLGALGKLGETDPKDTFCVPEKCMLKKLLSTGFSKPVQAPYGALVLSLKKKDRNSQQRIKRNIRNKLTASRKYPFSLLPNMFDRSRGVKYFPKSDIRPRYYRVRAMEAEGLETTCVTGLRAYEFLVAPSSLTDAKEGKCCSVQRQINVLGHVVEFHQIKSMKGFLTRASSRTDWLEEEDIQWGGNLECQAAFDGLKQVTIEGPSLGVAGAIKSPKIEAEQFNCMLGENLHHFVDGRQKNWVPLLNVAQFGHSSQIDSLIKRSQFEIKGSRHFVLPPVTDDPYVGNNPQVHRVEKEWKQMADMARVCLEEASRPMEERVDQKRCPIEFEWMTKLSINGATTSCDYLSTWNRKNIEESKKSLLIE
ncbi:uncharacterized protein E5676_scaffold360G001010 [Cucumis melo var. makuwa]|uniref:Retrotransposon gag domain-containing protein n=1 Tax=Cucumis melo var. makuwa TaxID=1194695 RepID=A0A5A7T2X9_CUCMM|nr:uncharacterized protein E6C27_scaffold147G00010 [Cucumis melo var. makuwa]TYK00051.1 uncharacterized protein E5676_scaffold360G001010 [Cucumis melo var. makuwa]